MKIKHPKTFVPTVVSVTMMLLLLQLPAIAAIIGIAPLMPLPAAYAIDDEDDNDSCINYDRSDKMVELACDTTFEQLANNIRDDSVIKNLGNGEYLLSASIEVTDKSRLTIASPAVTWIKISNEGSPQYNINVAGGRMDINGVRITSWDPDENSTVDQNTKGSVPRPYIHEQNARGGIIQNSELGYLGYDGGHLRGLSFVDKSANIEIRNNIFHHFWYAFYSNGASNVTIDGNIYHDNHLYAIDPHTGTHHMNITNNHVYNNPSSGIICSIDCSNILVENNTVHDNGSNGISLSRNMQDSIVRNNTIYNLPRGIVINDSRDNEVYGNTIYNVSEGIHYTDVQVTKNKIYNNTISEKQDADT